MVKMNKNPVPLNIGEKVAAFYDFYDYKTFWVKREYDHQADVIALKRFLKKVDGERQRIIDVGVGLGRLVPYYAPLYKEAVLLDSSTLQLKKTRHRLDEKYSNLTFVHGMAQDMSFPSNHADVILCVRVSHHIIDLFKFIRESFRVLKPGGYLILEVANKLHMKARLPALFRGTLKQLYSPDPVPVNDESEDDIPFVNHNPKTVERTLRGAGFRIVAVRSVSNFRSPLLKKIVPLKILLLLEWMTQRLFARLWFGPSIYFLAEKKK
ncbi:class I SAM-dependent methyltransferase [Patescibacteria group bacterium]|nr:class I SAM-dependent methyltransferase [Patescibacteria group bacterium]